MKFHLLLFILFCFSGKSQTIKELIIPGPYGYSVDSIYTLIGGSETNDTIQNKRLVYLSTSFYENDSISELDDLHTYYLTINDTIKTDSLNLIHFKSYVRKAWEESDFATSTNIQTGQELKFFLSNDSIISLQAIIIKNNLFSTCINYCSYHFDIYYAITDEDIESLKNIQIKKVVQDYGNGFFLVAKTNERFVKRFHSCFKSK
tara:strand:- start:618 stop:1229 length:612 start_codon:yes stop_codon:yes gene_type:complete